LIIGGVNVWVARATSRREQSLDLLKWGGEQAVAEDNERANMMGMKALEALGKAQLLSKADKRVLWAINLAVLAPITTAYPEDTDLPIVVEGEDD